MKRILAVTLCVVIALFSFAACGDSSEGITAGWFMGEVTEVHGGYVLLEVYSAYTDEYGDEVKVKSGGISSMNICEGDELRIYPKSIEDGTVKASTVELTVCVDSAPDVRKFDSVSVPSELIGLDLSSENTSVKSGCFYSAYRVVEQTAGRTYLAVADAAEAEYMIIGDMREDFKTGDLVMLESKQHTRYGCYYVVYKDDITATGVVDHSRAQSEIHETNSNKGMLVDKPVVYLYPEETVTVDVVLEIDGELTCTYPEYDGGGWNGLTVSPDGTISKGDREYYCLYFEGNADMEPDLSRGFCVKGSDTAEFLEDILKEIGLNDREANEFIIYWLPLMQENEYNLISFQGKNYTDAVSLEITPTPDSVLRVYMSFKPLEEPVEIEPQTFDGFERQGFTVVEWGGGKAE